MRVASQAWELQRQVKSQADWKSVSEHWQDAIEQLKTVPKFALSYTIAQENLVRYQENLDRAKHMSKLSE